MVEFIFADENKETDSVERVVAVITQKDFLKFVSVASRD